MPKKTVCPRCGYDCESTESVFVCDHCGFAFSRCASSFQCEEIFRGTIKTESTVTQTIEQCARAGGEGTPIVLRIGGN